MCSLKKSLGCWVVLNKMFSLKKKKGNKKKQQGSQSEHAGDKHLSATEKLLLRVSPLWKAAALLWFVSSDTELCAALRARVHSEQFVNQCHYPASQTWAGASAWLQPGLELSKLTERGLTSHSTNSLFHWRVFSYVFGVLVYFSWSITL